MEDEEIGFFAVGLIVGMLLMCLFTGLYFIGDKLDTIDTEELGTIMCGEYGLEYDYRDFGGTMIPTIHCKENETKEEKQLLDGILVR